MADKKLNMKLPLVKLENGGQLKWKNVFEIRTDLALEVNEQVNREKGRLKGVIINEMKDNKTGIKVTVIEITGKEGVKALHRRKEVYYNWSRKAGNNRWWIQPAHGSYSCQKSRRLLSGYIREKEKATVLVLGLGNADVTADALGPDVVKNIEINRHYAKEAGIQVAVAGLAPGVMAQTGMETAELVRAWCVS